MLRTRLFMLSLVLIDHWLEKAVIGGFLVLLISLLEIRIRVALMVLLLTFLICELVCSVGCRLILIL